ncbi:MAG TPA: hypothetical protein VJP88_08620 [Caulobacteraceae bacterium]|nr:hypothetical protein [Caulobacteraceae bacterium]
MADKDLIDPRQRIAAGALLLAVDFPVEMGAFARLMKDAGRFLPKGTTVPELRLGNRREALQHARALIDAMLAEI